MGADGRAYKPADLEGVEGFGEGVEAVHGLIVTWAEAVPPRRIRMQSLGEVEGAAQPVGP